MWLLRGHLVSSCAAWTLWDLLDGVVVVDDLGRIMEVGAASEVLPRFPGQRVEDVRPWWVMPGLVDLHTHLPQYGAVAMDGSTLLDWLETHIYPAEAKFQDGWFARAAAERFFQALLARGTTTAVVLSTVHASATEAAFLEAERIGLRAVIGKVMMDCRGPESLQEDTEASLEASEALCQTWHGRDHGRLAYAFTPRFAPVCSPALLRGAGDLAAKYGAYVQTHLAETLEECDWVRQLFPNTRNYTEVYAQAGLLGKRTLLAHGIYLSSEECTAIRVAGATVVHCPRANAFLGSGIMPLRKYLEAGLSVGLGTDVGAGPTLSLWAEAGFACMVSKLRGAGLRASTGVSERALSPLEAFHLATLGGAQALGLEATVGSIEPGKDADLMLVDPWVVDPLSEYEESRLPEWVLSRLLYRERPAMVKATYVRGRRCWWAGG